MEHTPLRGYAPAAPAVASDRPAVASDMISVVASDILAVAPDPPAVALDKTVVASDILAVAPETIVVPSQSALVSTHTAVLSDVVKKQQRQKLGMVRTSKGKGSNKVNSIAIPVEMPDVYAVHPDVRPKAFKDPLDNTAKKFETYLPRNYQVRGISPPTSVI